MRIVAVDAGHVCDQARRVVSLALAQAPERLLLFGATGEVAREHVAHEQARRDERYLDLAARWLLERGEGPPPTRAGLEVPLLEIGVAVRDDERCAPVPSSDRVIELVGAQLCMAVPDRGRIADDEWDNAALWIAGAEREPSVREDRAHPLVTPGDAGAGAGLTVVDLGAGEARVAVYAPDGSLVSTHRLSLGGGPRFTVKAAGGATS